MRPAALLCTLLAMLAFAGNSLLCRLALKTATIDPGSFTAVRLVSGAAMLLVICGLQGARLREAVAGSAWGAVTLSAYAATFSYAYVTLDAASGALLLFGFVQGTMIVAALIGGERPRAREGLGWIVAAAGLVWLLLPGAHRPEPAGAALMATAGIAWGLYTVHGRRAGAAPLPRTAVNFAFAALLLLPFAPLLLPAAQVSTAGVLLAAASGALTSGLGYVLWYAALRWLRSIQAALVQLSVPALTAAGGMLLLDEALSLRLLLAAALVLGGIAFAFTRSAGRSV